jgi:TonB-linked SusC/RagA family outer membrane protein
MQVFAIIKVFCMGKALPTRICPMLKKIVSRQMVRVMKLTAIILLTVCMHVSARGVAQTISLSVKNADLYTVLKAIEKQTDYVFMVEKQWLQKAKKVNLSVNNLPLIQVLELCFKDQPLYYKISGKIIAIGPKNIISKSEEEAMKVEQSIELMDIKGRVVNSQGEPIPNATVSVQGSSKRTITNPNGEFMFAGLDNNAVVVITHVQYETMIIPIKGKGVVSVTLQFKISSLDELQIIAYGTTTKRFSTGNISSIKSSDIEKQSVSNPLLALEGRVPGLFITQQSGVTGGPVTIRIQGQNSIAKGNDPLIVIDGVPFYSDMPRTLNEGALYPNSSISNPSALNFINPADIESIDILKDADATAIYGSRAANGAILITTKRGKSGAAKIDLNLQQGWGKVTRTMDLLNRTQYLDMRYEALRNDGVPAVPSTQYDLTLWDTTRYTDWQKFLIGGTAEYTNANLSISGGSTNMQYLVGGSFNRTTTVFPGDFNDQRGAIHFSIGGSGLNQRLKIQFSGNYMIDRNQLPGTDFTESAIKLEPVAPEIYNPDGTLNWAPNASGTSTWNNPMASILYTKSAIKTNNLVSNLILGYTVFPGLEIKSSFGYTNLQTTDFKGSMIGAIKPENRNVTPLPRTASYGSRLMNSWILEPQISYHKNIGNGKLEALLGYTLNQQESDWRTLSGTGFSNDAAIKNPQAATSLSIVNVGNSLYKYNAVFSRLNYNWNKKYIINLTARRDGSSRFGDKNKFHSFGSIGGAWIVNEESFFPRKWDWLSFVKLRGSIGTTGSDQVGDYAYLSTYGIVSVSVPYQNSIGLKPDALSNSYLEWENTRKIQGGADFSFFHDRVMLNATYALNRSSNQLLSYNLPWITGFPGITDNFPATVKNTSWEFLLITNNFRVKSFSWVSSLNLTIPKNKLVSFPNLETSSYASQLVIGQPISIIKAYQFGGVDPATGKYMFVDAKGNLTSNPNGLTDKTVVINKLPKFYGGFQNTFNYKGFELDFIWQFVKQIGTPIIYNNSTSISPGVFSSGSSNQPAAVLDRWQKVEDNKPIERYTTNSLTLQFNMANAKISDAGFKDASFIRLKNLSFSWQLPKQWQHKLQLKNFRVYIQGQNLLTITNYQGLDPENQAFDGLPPLRMITSGLRIGF